MRITTALLLGLLAACGASSASSMSPSDVSPPSEASPPAYQPTSFTVATSGSGRPVLFIPGLNCDGHVWDATLAHLDGSVEAHVLTLAGFAGQPAISAPLLPTVHDEIVAYIRAHHLDHPLLLGHSLGAFMAFWVAETDSDLIGGIAAVDGAPFLAALQDPNATPASVAPIAQSVHDQILASPDDFAAGMRQFMTSMMNEPAKHEPLIASWTKSDPRTTADALVYLFQHDLRADVAKISVPVVAIAAADNATGAIPRPTLEAAWHAQIDPAPHHQLVIIEHAKHFLMLDQPDAFYAALDAFLAAR